jgi:hypothetical protein
LTNASAVDSDTAKLTWDVSTKEKYLNVWGWKVLKYFEKNIFDFLKKNYQRIKLKIKNKFKALKMSIRFYSTKELTFLRKNIPFPACKIFHTLTTEF